MKNLDWELILMYSVKYFRKLELKLTDGRRLKGQIINFNEKYINIDIKNIMTPIYYEDIEILNYI